jgi:hypothetical protein
MGEVMADPKYTKANLDLVRSMSHQIAVAAARYGVSAEAIAGSLAQEQFDQGASLWNEFKAVGSAARAKLFLDTTYLEGAVTSPFHPQSEASGLILDQYNASPDAVTVGSDVRKKVFDGLLVDYGPAGMKFQNAIQAIMKNPDDPAFAQYVNNLYSAGVALQNGSDPSLMASSMAAYLQQATRFYQSNMSVNGDPTTGINAWNGLSPSLQNALLVQYYKQGPAPQRVQAAMMAAAQNGLPYVPKIGTDGAGATYIANEAAIKQALAAEAPPPKPGQSPSSGTSADPRPPEHGPGSSQPPEQSSAPASQLRPGVPGAAPLQSRPAPDPRQSTPPGPHPVVPPPGKSGSIDPLSPGVGPGLGYAPIDGPNLHPVSWGFDSPSESGQPGSKEHADDKLSPALFDTASRFGDSIDLPAFNTRQGLIEQSMRTGAFENLRDRLPQPEAGTYRSPQAAPTSPGIAAQPSAASLAPSRLQPFLAPGMQAPIFVQPERQAEKQADPFADPAAATPEQRIDPGWSSFPWQDQPDLAAGNVAPPSPAGPPPSWLQPYLAPGIQAPIFVQTET